MTITESELSSADGERLHRLHEEILRAALRDHPAKEIIEEICRLAESMISESVATVLLLDSNGMLQPFAAPSVPAKAIDCLRDLRPGPQSGSCGNAVLRQEPVYVCDTLQDDRWGLLRNFAKDFGILSCWSTPIWNAAKAVQGSFALSSFVRRAPGLFERLILDAAAQAVAQVLQRDSLVQQRNLQSHALESISEGVLISDAAQNTLWVNPAFTRITGYTQSDMKGKNCRILQGQRTSLDARTKISQSLAQGKSFHGEIGNYRKDGTFFWNLLAISPVRDDSGQVTHYVSVQRDITRRKEQEQNLRLAAVAFEVDEGIMISDAKRRIVRVNQAFCRTTGYSEAEVLGKTPAFLYSGQQDTDFYAAMWDDIRKKGSWKGEIWNRRKNGEIFPEWLTITAVQDDSGEIENYVAYFRDISDQKAQEEKLRILALFDPLTELPNRTLFAQTVAEALASGTDVPKRSDGRLVAVGLLDLDGFKEINDTLGHDAGDALLKLLGKHFRERTRQDEVMARLGGDEFGFVVWVSSLAELERLSDRLLAQVREIAVQFSEVPVSASLGWALSPEDGKNYNDLLAHADEAMYAAKAEGKSTYRFYHGAVEQRAEQRIRVHRQLPLGIVAGDVDFFLQPQIELPRGKITGAELLVRWRQPGGRWLFPGKFVSYVEEDTHLTRSLGIYALMRAQEMQEKLRQEGQQFVLSVNIGAKHFLHPEFLQDIAEFCPNGGGLQIEVTETVALHDLRRARKVADTLKSRGFTLSLDDFGSGYASLQYLTELPFDEIKLDQGFTRKITQCMDCLSVTSATVLIAQLSGRTLIAEGIYRPEQLQLLMRLGCRHFQGYFLAPPLPVSAFLTWKKWVFLSVTKMPEIVPQEHLALLMLESEDFHWRKKMSAASCPVSQWIGRQANRLGEDPDFQVIARLHPLLHFGGAQRHKEQQEILGQIREAVDALLTRLCSENA